MHSTSENFFIGALIGGTIGAAAALMLTPLSGEKLRQKIAHGMHFSPNGTAPKRRPMANADHKAPSLHKPKSPSPRSTKSNTPAKGRRKPTSEA